MSDLERAKLIPVSGTNDTPDLQNAVDVQFNPVSLKVNLANTLKANTGNSNSRATQFVDKSSSTLTVELVFDTTYIEAPSSASPSGAQSSDASQSNSSRNQIEQGSDVRIQTRKIADKFIKPVESGNQMQAPSRVLFQWGSFEFIGMVSSYDETLDFFSPKGRPLRATVALKLNEDRYQFRSNDDADKDMAQSPTAAFTGNGAGAGDPGGGSNAGNGAGAPNQSVSPVPGGSDGPGNWRDNAMFNGIESPRLPSASTLALPSVSLGAGAGFGISGGAGIGLSGGIGISGGVDVNVSASVNLGASVGASAAVGNSAGGAGKAGASATGAGSTGSGAGSTASAAASKAQPTPSPAFKYGNSGALGTGVPGAFSPRPAATLKASALQAGSLVLRAPTTAPSASGQAAPGTSNAVPSRQASRPERRQPSGVSVTHLLKSGADNGVGFD